MLTFYFIYHAVKETFLTNDLGTQTKTEGTFRWQIKDSDACCVSLRMHACVCTVMAGYKETVLKNYF